MLVRIVLSRVSGYTGLGSSICVCVCVCLGPNFNAILKCKDKCWKVNTSILLEWNLKSSPSTWNKTKYLQRCWTFSAFGVFMPLDRQILSSQFTISEEKLLLDLSNFVKFKEWLSVSVLIASEWREILTTVNSFCSLLIKSVLSAQYREQL